MTPESCRQWADERLANSERIAAEKTGEERDGWLEDVAYWREIVTELRERASLLKEINIQRTRNTELDDAHKRTIRRADATVKVFQAIAKACADNGVSDTDDVPLADVIRGALSQLRGQIQSLETAREFAYAEIRQLKADAALRACAEAPAPKEQMKDATGWVIERHLHSRLHYWTGRPSSTLGAWSEKHADALRFARRADAELMLTYHCNGEGNVVEHLWRAEAPATGLPRYRLVDRASSRRNDELVDLLGGTHVYLAADVDALSEARAEAPDHESERLIEHMVNRFLAWRLPEDFNPDGGINFTRDFNEHTAYPMKHEPTGTNLFTATQAEAMVRYMLGAEAPATDKKRMLFEIEAAQAEMLRAFLSTHQCRSLNRAAIQASPIEIVFTQLSIAMHCEARCTICKAKVDLNDYDSW